MENYTFFSTYEKRWWTVVRHRCLGFPAAAIASVFSVLIVDFAACAATFSWLHRFEISIAPCI